MFLENFTSENDLEFSFDVLLDVILQIFKIDYEMIFEVL